MVLEEFVAGHTHLGEQWILRSWRDQRATEYGSLRSSVHMSMHQRTRSAGLDCSLSRS